MSHQWQPIDGYLFYICLLQSAKSVVCNLPNLPSASCYIRRLLAVPITVELSVLVVFNFDTIIDLGHLPETNLRSARQARLGARDQAGTSPSTYDKLQIVRDSLCRIQSVILQALKNRTFFCVSTEALLMCLASGITEFESVSM